MSTEHPDSVSASEVKDLLVAARGEWPEISYQAKVSYSWISKFVNGHIPHPGHQTLLKVKAYMAGRTRHAPNHVGA